MTPQPILNFGSINIDHVYHLPHFVRPGETLASVSYARHPGGKGLNQSIAIARAGGNVRHVGRLGKNDLWLLELLKHEGIETSFVTSGDTPTGHAVIQIDSTAQNAIVLNGGANREIDSSQIQNALDSASTHTIVLLQNETSGVREVIESAHGRSLPVYFNPAPMDPGVLELPLEKTSGLILNETEGAALAGVESPREILDRLGARYPDTLLVLTRGSEGVLWKEPQRAIQSQPTFPCKTVDTTAAGDTFLGYFLTALSQGKPIDEACRLGCKAASICVSRPGATPSIPRIEEV